jgi:hypothetical protein
MELRLEELAATAAKVLRNVVKALAKGPCKCSHGPLRITLK